jgi:hypothetical protein
MKATNERQTRQGIKQDNKNVSLQLQLDDFDSRLN